MASPLGEKKMTQNEKFILGKSHGSLEGPEVRVKTTSPSRQHSCQPACHSEAGAPTENENY